MRIPGVLAHGEDVNRDPTGWGFIGAETLQPG